MIAINPNSECDESKLYYYDYLNNLKENIPLNVSRHIDKCSFCQSEISRLSHIISENKYEHESSKQINTIIATSLKLHFAYENTKVECQNVKSFLPSLADPLLKIRIPTPITVHIENCKKCRENLEVLRGLGLNHKQLCTLGQIFAEPHPQKELCTKALESVSHVVSLSLNKTTSDNLKHLCICSDCRSQLYQRRDLVCEGLSKSDITDKNFPCKSVQPTDIFDYCFPYSVEVENDQYAKFRSALTSHLSVCATCLNKMQKLHATISQILECANSGIVTFYRITSDKKAKGIYKEWPIEVKVYDSSQRVPIEISEEHKTKVLKRSHVGNFIKISSVAAVILFFFILYFNIPSAKAVSLNQIFNAIRKLQNVYFATYVPNEDKPVQEEWISTSLNTVLLKTNSRIVLWSINNKIHKSIDLQAADSQIVQSDYENWDGIKNILIPPWGLLPFNDIDDAPENSNAKWKTTDDKIIDVPIENTEIYELTWQEQTFGGSVVFNKWRCYIDVDTKLLKRYEFWQKLGTDEGYDLKVIKVIEFPSVNEIEKQIKDVGF